MLNPERPTVDTARLELTAAASGAPRLRLSGKHEKMPEASRQEILVDLAVLCDTKKLLAARSRRCQHSGVEARYRPLRSGRTPVRSEGRAPLRDQILSLHAAVTHARLAGCHGLLSSVL